MRRVALLLSVVTVPNSATAAREPVGLHHALSQLARQGQFSGAVVVRGPEGVRFARGYGVADPFTGRAFTPETPVDSGSMAKPVTAAAVLLLAREGEVDLDAPVRRYLPEYPHAGTSVRHLLAHSAALAFPNSPEALAGKTNSSLLVEAGRHPLLFEPGTAFTYCNLCYSTLALLIERVSGEHYLDFVKREALLPAGVALRPARLADWKGRAIGHRRTIDGKLERFDSWEGEAFYGTANFSLSAVQLAQWGAEWWRSPLSSIRAEATTPALISGKSSGLSWGNWYCASERHRCHYLGHHEGFHHMLYWDADRRISVAMVTNNGMRATLHQSLQRALVAFAEGRPRAARRTLAVEPADVPVPAGQFELLPTGERVRIDSDGKKVKLERRGLVYEAFQVGSGVRYAPGLDLYLTGHPHGGVRWISLYEDIVARPSPPRGH